MKSQHFILRKRLIFSIIEKSDILRYSLAPKRKKKIKMVQYKSCRKFSVEQFLLQTFFDIVDITGNTLKKLIFREFQPL